MSNLIYSNSAESLLFKKREQSNSLFTAIFGILAAISFVSIFVMAIFFQQKLEANNMVWLIIAVFGSTFLFGGLTVTSTGTYIGLIFATIGGAISAFSLVYGFGSASVQGLLMECIIPIVGTSLFVIVGAAIIGVPLWMDKKLSNTYTEAVNAVITDKRVNVTRDSDGHRHRTYRLTWDYDYGFDKYRYVSNRGRSPERREVGEYGYLYIKPGYPDTVWEPFGKLEKIIFIVVGGAFAAIGCFATVMMVISIFLG